MQTARTAAVQAYNDDRTVTKQSKPAAKNERPEKKPLSKIASAKTAPAKMQKKFPNRGKMALQPHHESNDD